MEKHELMDKREERIMECLWKHDEALSTAELERLFEGEKKTGKATIFKAVQSLMNKGYISVGGLERNVNSYARKFFPAITRQQYAAYALEENGINISSIGKVIEAMIESCEKPSSSEKKKVVSELEDIIKKLK
ncbi:Penicillinase repressor [Lachnospiraceae bacterium KH1T2]|nr:Penicillinase repressor [Lachnospiraceae bacterium KH1T2]